ncbi:MAG: efflux RND transporter periplasmic adaptor subunit [Bryobacterales bacterium]|nr:efflux RND transporter periplasmic adaptor subunit [Bryobacterales bacterium]
MNRKLIPIALAVLLAVSVAAWWFGFHRRQPPGVIKISGNIELTEVNIGFRTPGQLVELTVKEGDLVKAGQVIGRLDTAQLESQKRMSEAVLASAESRLKQLGSSIDLQEQSLEAMTTQRRAELAAVEAQLRELLAGSRTQEKEQARAFAAQAEAEAVRAAADWKRAQTLFASEDITAADRDRAKAAHEATEAAVRQARERLALVEEGPRVETIEAMRAQVSRAKAALHATEAGRYDSDRLRQERTSRMAEIEQAKASLAVVETQLKDAIARSPVDGVVLVKSAEAGEVLAAGTTIATIADLAHPWLRGYVGQQNQGRVQIGAPVEVVTDSLPNRRFQGRLSFIASEAEFTPKQIQTEEERVKLVYRVKIDLENPEGVLKANMPADAFLPLLAAEAAK